MKVVLIEKKNVYEFHFFIKKIISIMVVLAIKIKY